MVIMMMKSHAMMPRVGVELLASLLHNIEDPILNMVMEIN
jgi:hypothetical protein